jgi:hypothetical protein
MPTAVMPRKRSGRKDRELEGQADWEACIAWRRMYVAIMNAEWDLRIPLTGWLLDTRERVAEVASEESRALASRYLRKAWIALREDDVWFACLHGIRARTVGREADTSDEREIEGRTLCIVFRSAYKKAPPGFERVGRSAEGRII